MRLQSRQPHDTRKRVPQEQEVALGWQALSSGPDRPWLATACGHRFRVLFPGRPSPSAGPDFRNAVLLTAEGERLHGDVEVHSVATAFYQHGHHQDPRYDQVILHVVGAGQAGAEVRLHSGRTAPGLALPAAPHGETGTGVLPCHGVTSRQGEEAVGRFLDRAGDERFRMKSERLAARLRWLPPDETLYQGILEGLGYGGNQRGFLETAQRIPFAQLRAEALALEPDRRTQRCQRSLLAAAFPTEAGPGPSWQGFRVRPANAPRRRLLGTGTLLARLLDCGLTGGLLAPLRLGGESVAALRALLTVPAPLGPALIGPNRADDLIINLVLPFASVWGRLNGEPALASAALALYQGYPKGPGNETTRAVLSQFGCRGSTGLAMNARRQQGLIHLYKTRCVDLRCADCPLAANEGTAYA